MPAEMTLAHLGYVVRNMDTAIQRFVAEGARILIPPILDPVQRVYVCLLALAGDVPLELVAPAGFPDCPIQGRLARGGGLDHLCYQVDDLEQAIALEEGAGSMVVCRPCHAIAFGRDVAFVHRRSGLVVEYMARSEKPEG